MQKVLSMTYQHRMHPSSGTQCTSACRYMSVIGSHNSAREKRGQHKHERLPEPSQAASAPHHVPEKGIVDSI